MHAAARFATSVLQFCKYVFDLMQKGFPLDSDLDSLMAFFEKFGTTELVQMRRNKKKEFKVNWFAAVCMFYAYCFDE